MEDEMTRRTVKKKFLMADNLKEELRDTVLWGVPGIAYKTIVQRYLNNERTMKDEDKN